MKMFKCWYIDCEEDVAFILASFRNELHLTSCPLHVVEGVRDLEARDRSAVKVGTIGAKYR